MEDADGEEQLDNNQQHVLSSHSSFLPPDTSVIIPGQPQEQFDGAASPPFASTNTSKLTYTDLQLRVQLLEAALEQQQQSSQSVLAATLAAHAAEEASVKQFYDAQLCDLMDRLADVVHNQQQQHQQQQEEPTAASLGGSNIHARSSTAEGRFDRFAEGCDDQDDDDDASRAPSEHHTTTITTAAAAVAGDGLSCSPTGSFQRAAASAPTKRGSAVKAAAERSPSPAAARRGGGGVGGGVDDASVLLRRELAAAEGLLRSSQEENRAAARRIKVGCVSLVLSEGLAERQRAPPPPSLAHSVLSNPNTV